MKFRLGLVNMMADKAVVVSERHFTTLFGADTGREIELLRYTFDEIPREPNVAAHIKLHYRHVRNLPHDRLDALAITGANVSDPILSQQIFWRPLIELLDWALAADVPTLCSCLATHAVLEARHGQQRRPVTPKIWGVFEHSSPSRSYPLLGGLPTSVSAPHSRHNDVSAEQFVAAGYDVVLSSATAGVHLAVERERGRWLLLQGHPEYEKVSLLKEYKREVIRWQDGQRDEYPPLPVGYANGESEEILAEYRRACLSDGPTAEFPEAEVAPLLVDTWTENAVGVVANWLASLG